MGIFWDYYCVEGFRSIAGVRFFRPMPVLLSKKIPFCKFPTIKTWKFSEACEIGTKPLPWFLHMLGMFSRSFSSRKLRSSWIDIEELCQTLFYPWSSLCGDIGIGQVRVTPFFDAIYNVYVLCWYWCITLTSSLKGKYTRVVFEQVNYQRLKAFHL